MNANVFTLLHESRLAIPLPKGGTREFPEEVQERPYEAYGNVMKEYVAVPNDPLAKTKEPQKYLDVSYEYTKTLKPKPAKKR